MRYLLRRVGLALLLVWVVAPIVFMAIHLVPGDPAEILMSSGGATPDPGAVAELRDQERRIGGRRTTAEGPQVAGQSGVLLRTQPTGGARAEVRRGQGVDAGRTTLATDKALDSRAPTALSRHGVARECRRRRTSGRAAAGARGAAGPWPRPG